MLRIYETSVAGGNVLSQDGVMSQPDSSDYDGTAGEAVAKKLYLAPAQTTLVYDIDDAQTQIEVTHAIFDDVNFLHIIIGSEPMEITSGRGTKILEVIRGDTPAAHSADDAVYNSYTYYGIKIEPTDEDDGDDADLVTYAPDSAGSPGSYVSSLSPSDFTDPTSDSYTFWRKIEIPVGDAERKINLRHAVLNFEAFEYSA